MTAMLSLLTRRLNRIPREALIFLLAIASNMLLAAIAPRVDWNRVGETARIAASIATGHGFSSPFRLPTGPSALVPPVYPYLLAGIFRAFGLYTAGAFRAAAALNVVAHAVSCLLLYWIARSVFGRRTGTLAAVALATFPLFFYPLVLLHVVGSVSTGLGIFIPPNLIWNTFLHELAILGILWLTLRQVHWAVYGLAWGIATLIDPSVVSLAPAFFAWRLWHGWEWRPLAFSAVAGALCITPWLIRDYVVFHHFIFIRDGLGLELRVGNQPGGKGLWSAHLHPEEDPQELSRVVQMGEYEYTRVAGQEALSSIRTHRGEYARNTLRRVAYFWFGDPAASHRLAHALVFLKYVPPFAFSMLAFCGAALTLMSRNRKALLLVAVLVFCPLVHYLTHDLRGFFFQWPIQPEMLALAAFASD